MPELRAHYMPGVREAGCDEAGRGCLAGPVVAAAVIFPNNYTLPHLNDSKQISARLREKLEGIIRREALSWSTVAVSPAEIDEVNILNASFLAMHRALDQLNIRPDHILVDGNRFNPYGDIPHYCAIKGDSRFTSVAAASVLAKVKRDSIMEDLHREYPHYDWQKNKGYPTTRHREAIRLHGASPYHRKSFRLLPDQLSLFGEG